VNDVTIAEPVQLAPRRCFECGRWWAYERFASGAPECPVCTGRANDRLRSRVSELERSAASLRGALTRAKERRE
jgi:hypothetical protein